MAKTYQLKADAGDVKEISLTLTDSTTVKLSGSRLQGARPKSEAEEFAFSNHPLLEAKEDDKPADGSKGEDQVTPSPGTAHVDGGNQ